MNRHTCVRADSPTASRLLQYMRMVVEEEGGIGCYGNSEQTVMLISVGAVGSHAVSREVVGEGE